MRTDELWCNGSTTDSDSVCLGSNPGSSTKNSLLLLLSREFFCAAAECLEMPPDVRNLEKVRFLREKLGKNAEIYVILYIN